MRKGMLAGFLAFTYVRPEPAGAAELKQETRSISGRIRTFSITKGAVVAAGSEIAPVDPGVEQIWKALRALCLVGQVEDLPLIHITWVTLLKFPIVSASRQF